MGSFDPHPTLPPPPVHGGLNPAALRARGIDPAQVIDFSANINPLGPSPRVKKALAGVDLAAYPDPHGTELREALAARTGVSAGQIVLGNGSTELIHLLARAFLKRRDRAVLLTPTFGEYQYACQLAGARVTPIAAKGERGFKWDISAVKQALNRLRPRLVFVCNPNNPTGVYWEEEAVTELAGQLPDALLILDEAYISFVPQAWESRPLLERGNVVLLRSMTKDYALAGLRLGYALAPAPVARALAAHQPTWSVSAPAQAAGLAALSDQEHLRRALDCVSQGKGVLERGLKALGLRFLPSQANFILIEVGDGAGVRERLLAKGIAVRDCTSFGLPRFIRVAVKTPAQCRKLLSALKGSLPI